MLTTEQLHNCIVAAFILLCSTSPTLFDTLIGVSQIQLRCKQLNPFSLFALQMHDSCKLGQVCLCGHTYLSTYNILYMLYTVTCSSFLSISLFSKCSQCAKNVIQPSQVMFLHIQCEKPQCDKACAPYGVYYQIKCIALP